ncbi:hypothetical protein C8C87_0391 [Flavobacterium sp. 120]|nr:hypothetical protein C8C87_0391 [Flavobacterium sp. 120]
MSNIFPPVIGSSSKVGGHTKRLDNLNKKNSDTQKNSIISNGVFYVYF